MGRDTPDLARVSLLIEKIGNNFDDIGADLLRRVHAFSMERAGADDPSRFRAAELLYNQDADVLTISSALLAPLVWRKQIALDEILAEFGPTLTSTLQDLNSPFILHIENQQYRREDIHALLTNMGGDPRRALLLIVFRLVALEQAKDPREETILRMARETLDFYVPIANRLSLSELRRRLEDACFQILDPPGYERLKRKVAPILAEDDACLQLLLAGVRRLLDSNGIQGRIQGRTKSLYGIHSKMVRTGRTLEEIMDRVGLRIIVASVPECYAVLGLLHTHFKPIPGTFDDYIGLPKDNGYQSLHTCVYPVREISRKPIEFQVRTELMHKEAEHGRAAHWRYKSESDAEEKDRRQSRWMEGLLHQHAKAASAEIFIELLHRQVFQDHLVVFGDGGRIVRLSEGATVQDYLNISNLPVPRGTVVMVNGERVSLEHPLRDGDSIEITAGNSGPVDQGGNQASPEAVMPRGLERIPGVSAASGSPREKNPPKENRYA